MVEDGGTEREVEVELVEVGDRIKVIPGQGIPVDGIVIAGKGQCNESMLTGESRPVLKDIESNVFGGAILTQGCLILRATKTSENSSFNQII